MIAPFSARHAHYLGALPGEELGDRPPMPRLAPVTIAVRPVIFAMAASP